MLTDEQIAAGWLPHDGGPRPVDYDGGICLFSDGSKAKPVGHQWAPFNDLVVVAYRPEPSA